MPSRIYLDHAATTPLSPVAREAMLPWLDAGNPSSLYAEGRRAKDALDAARETLSRALGCLFAEVLFTSGGTEAANLAILGSALGNENPGRNRVLLGAAEHHCVLHTESLLRRLGYRVDLVPVDREARIRSESLAALLGPDVLLVSVMHANNELGSINEVRSIASLAHDQGVLLHVDAVQTFLRPEAADGAHWKVADLDADLVTVSAHKVNGPKGAGAVFTRAGVKLKPLIGGGGQEREVRGGTENVAAIAGFGAAVAEHLATPRRIDSFIRDHLLDRLESLGAVRSVSHEPLLGGHAHVRFPGIDAETLLIALDRAGVSASSGAACSSGSVEPSHVLLACGYSAKEAREGLRFTLGAATTMAEVAEAVSRLAEILDRIRR
jgi:cysteine desulfurase